MQSAFTAQAFAAGTVVEPLPLQVPPCAPLRLVPSLLARPGKMQLTWLMTQGRCAQAQRPLGARAGAPSLPLRSASSPPPPPSLRHQELHLVLRALHLLRSAGSGGYRGYAISLWCRCHEGPCVLCALRDRTRHRVGAPGLDDQEMFMAAYTVCFSLLIMLFQMILLPPLLSSEVRTLTSLILAFLQTSSNS